MPVFLRCSLEHGVWQYLLLMWPCNLKPSSVISATPIFPPLPSSTSHLFPILCSLACLKLSLAPPRPLSSEICASLNPHVLFRVSSGLPSFRKRKKEGNFLSQRMSQILNNSAYIYHHTCNSYLA